MKKLRVCEHYIHRICWHGPVAGLIGMKVLVVISTTLLLVVVAITIVVESFVRFPLVAADSLVL